MPWWVSWMSYIGILTPELAMAVLIDSAYLCVTCVSSMEPKTTFLSE